jgi:RES domain-containing protein
MAKSAKVRDARAAARAGAASGSLPGIDPGANPRAGVAETLQAAGDIYAFNPGDPAPYTPPVSELPQVTTARLLPARYSDSVLTRIADSDEDLQAVYALDNATNQRLMAEANRELGVAAYELMFQGRYARIVNAAFTHPHPLGARFSTPYRGAWYAGFELATAKAEVLFHRALQLTEIAWNLPESLDYDHYSAEFSGPFHDLRQASEDDVRGSLASCLDPASYLASQQLAVHLLRRGSLGVVYPSTRRPSGTCLACFQPHAVTHVRKRELHRLTWHPDAPATFLRVPRTPQ